MNKYILRLNGGIGLGRWEVKYEDIKLAGVIWYCERQLTYFPNLQSIQIFDDDKECKYVGEVKAGVTYRYTPAAE